jgi:hypothetical protein
MRPIGFDGESWKFLGKILRTEQGLSSPKNYFFFKILRHIEFWGTCMKY